MIRWQLGAACLCGSCTAGGNAAGEDIARQSQDCTTPAMMRHDAATFYITTPMRLLPREETRSKYLANQLAQALQHSSLCFDTAALPDEAAKYAGRKW